MRRSNLAFTLLAVSICFAAESCSPLSHAATPTVEQIGIERGICVVIGDDAVEQAIELARETELTIYVQAADASAVESARKTIEATGFLGTRVYVRQGNLSQLYLADNTADAVIFTGELNDAIKAAAMKALRPRGRLLVGKETLTKPEPSGTDDWSHPYHGPDNNPQSRDEVARGPYLTQFMAEPWYATMPQMSVISGGRIFKVFGNRASARPQWPVLNTLMCINAHNGTILWRKDINPDFMPHRNTLIATPDVLYFADDKSCKLIDAATGEVKDEIVAPKELSDDTAWKWMALHDGVLYALVGEQEPAALAHKGERYRGAGWPWWKIENYKYGFGRTVLAIDPISKKILWHYRQADPLDSRAMCLLGGQMYVYSHAKFLACLDAVTGKPIWKNTDKEVMDAIGEHDAAQHWMKGFASTAYMKCSEDGLYFAGPTRKNIAAVSTKDGSLLWKRDGGNSQLVLRHDGVYALGEGTRNGVKSSFKLEPLSGEVLSTFPSRDRCTRATGCIDAIFTRGGAGGSTAVFNTTSGETTMSTIGPMRPACQDGVVVAHGQLYWGPWKCRCDGTQIGVICLANGGNFKYDAPAVESERLESTGQEPPQATEPDSKDWPTFRKDNSRRAQTGVRLPVDLKELWVSAPQANFVATAPVAVGQTVYMSGSDGVVRALNAANGEPRWTAFTGGSVGFPPSIARGRAYVGSGDGWIYCLDAASGQRLWRFRAAPAERTIPVYGSLHSTWPVGSGVLVDEGVAYAAAGMVNYDGAHVYALNADSGTIRWQVNTSGQEDATRPENGAGVQSPLLLFDGSIYMCGGGQAPLLSFDAKTGMCSRQGGGRGKDLFVFNGAVKASGNPLYWRQEDSHHIDSVALKTPAGHVSVVNGQLALVGDKKTDDGKPVATWSSKVVQEISGLAMSGDLIVATGVNREINGDDVKESALVCTLNLADGKIAWQAPLPALPVSWGLAIDRDGRLLVSLRDGRIVCFGTK